MGFVATDNRGGGTGGSGQDVAVAVLERLHASNAKACPGVASSSNRVGDKTAPDSEKGDPTCRNKRGATSANGSMTTSRKGSLTGARTRTPLRRSRLAP